jgi:hypothetical protein
LTGDNFHKERVIADREKREKEADKAHRKENKETQKVRNEAVAKLWKERNDPHKEAVAKWTEICAKLKMQDTKVKDLPKKPARPKKADIEKEVDGDSSSSKEGDSEDEESTDDE